MPQQPTTKGIIPIISNHALGLNDFMSPVKVKPGQMPFALNFDAQSDVWNRRIGRNTEYYETGAVLGISYITWDDGTSTEIAQIDDELYDMRFSYTYMFALGTRLIYLDTLGAYWNVTPGAATEVINPVVVATPTAAAQTADISIAVGQNIGFAVNSGSVQVLCDETKDAGWYLKKRGTSMAISEVTTDWVFDMSTAFRLKMFDNSGNEWEFNITDDGNFYCVTI